MIRDQEEQERIEKEREAKRKKKTIGYGNVNNYLQNFKNMLYLQI